jgi:hypothetical protein
MCGGESFADDLNSGQGTVSGRVALLLRSAEVKPLFYRFVQPRVELFSFFAHALNIRAGLSFDSGPRAACGKATNSGIGLCILSTAIGL